MPDSIVSPAHSITIRPSIPADVPTLFDLIMALAEYERLSHEVTGSPQVLHQHLFGDFPCIETVVAEWQGQVVGFALFFVNYSTSLMRPGIYLEDLFVLPQYRGQRVGKALLTYLAQLTVERGYGRLEWSVLDWNQPAIGFYKRIGAEILEDVRVCRVAGAALPQLASLSSCNLRPGTPDDIAAIFTLVKANVEYDGGLHQFNGHEAALAQHLFEQSYAEVVIAEQNSQPVGIGLFCTTYSTFLTKPGLFIEDLFVLPDYRGQGIGKAILAYLAQQVTDRDYGRLEWRVRVWNQQAINFYERMGAVILPDWRVCQLYEAAIEKLVQTENIFPA